MRVNTTTAFEGVVAVTNDRDRPDEVERIADAICTAYKPRERGKSPTVTRASATYVAYLLTGRKDQITQDEVADAFDCSTGAIRNRKREIFDAVDIESIRNPTDEDDPRIRCTDCSYTERDRASPYIIGAECPVCRVGVLKSND